MQAQFGAESALAFDRAERGIDVTISNTTGELGLKAVIGDSLMIDNSPGLSLSGTMAVSSGGRASCGAFLDGLSILVHRGGQFSTTNANGNGVLTVEAGRSCSVLDC
eukprot:SAG31_NODE_17173_length_680_cov_1.339071_1_plen_106_part_10